MTNRFSAPRFLALLAGLAVGACASAAGAAGTLDRAELTRFLVQCISTDAAGRPSFPTVGDPACRGGLQELSTPAEWRKHDWGQRGDDGKASLLGHQVSDSVLDRSGERHYIVQTFDFGDEGRRFARFDKGNGDGGDLLTIVDDAVYGVFTEDGGAGEQWFVSSHCGDDPRPEGRMKAWLFFGADVVSGRWTERTVRLNITQSPDECPAEFNAAYTRYRREPIRVPFRSVDGDRPSDTQAREIDTVVSEHYDGTSIANGNHLERFFFGRGVGKYRWERWEHVGLTAMTDATERASGFAKSGRCAPLAYSVKPADGWVMVDCRTWTSLVKLQRPWPVANFGWPGRAGQQP